MHPILGTSDGLEERIPTASYNRAEEQENPPETEDHDRRNGTDGPENRCGGEDHEVEEFSRVAGFQAKRPTGQGSYDTQSKSDGSE